MAKSKSSPSPLVSTYLALYNIGQAALWTYLLAHEFVHYLNVSQSLGLTDPKSIFEAGYPSLYKSTTLFGTFGTDLIFIQTLAILDIFNVAIGVVPSNIVTTIMQVSSRLLVVWGAFHYFPVSHTVWAVSGVVFAWCLAEIIRYLYYFFNQILLSVPYFLAWVRYSVQFISISPLGIFHSLSFWGIL